MAEAALLNDFLKIQLISYITGRMPEGIGVGNLNGQKLTEKKTRGQVQEVVRDM